MFKSSQEIKSFRLSKRDHFNLSLRMSKNEDFLFGNALWVVVGAIFIIGGLIGNSVGAIIIGGACALIGIFNKVK